MSELEYCAKIDLQKNSWFGIYRCFEHYTVIEIDREKKRQANEKVNKYRYFVTI